MSGFLTETITFTLDLDDLAKRLRVRAGGEDESVLRGLADEALAIGRPKAIYRAVKVASLTDDTVTVDGFVFTSRVLRVNLGSTQIVYPFVATCGSELQDWSDGIKDWLLHYWAEMIKEDALRCALEAFRAHLQAQYPLGHTSTMSPGSLEDWPISQQAVLFALLGNLVDQCGVRLTDTMLMIPSKTVSGIVFETDASFESCMLCPRENCPGRRAPYDETLYERAYCPAHR